MLELNGVAWCQLGTKDIYTNIREVEQPIEALNPLHIRMFHISGENEKFVGDMLDRILLYLDMIHIKDTLYTILKESINNGIKANAKRVFFHLKGLDINDRENYDRIMSSFREEAFGNIDRYHDYLKEH